MGENIDPTWLAFAARGPLSASEVDGALGRVSRHYSKLVDYPQATASAYQGSCGIAIAGDAEPRCRWPLFAEDPELAIATAHVPTGWSALVPGGLERAPARLARLATDDPAAVSARLSAPVAIAVLERGAGGLTVLNDALGAARVFELETERVRVWSNRPGALALFAGTAPAADEDAWAIMAAAGWLLGAAAPMAGVRRLGPGTVIRVDPDGEVSEEQTDAVAQLIRPSGDLPDLVGPAAEAMRWRATEVADLWPGEPQVDLSGGRDSRVVAAATLAAGIPALYKTSNATPGEARVAKELIGLAPGEPQHRVGRRREGSASPGTPLLERARNLHLLHDGVRHPQKLRGKMTLPRPRPERPVFSGHGGEIAHGFFYSSRREVWRLRGSRGRLTARVLRFFRQGHDAVRPSASDAAEAVVRETLAEGRRLGMRGPALLDWFYLIDRFAHRSGVATDSERVALFATPEVIAASFALAPKDRVASLLHEELIARFVPEWRGVEYFQPTEERVKRIKRERIWDVDADASVVEGILAAGGAWADAFDRDRAIAMWQEVRAGRAKPKWEGLFEGIVYRATFDEHLAELARAARE